MKMVVMAASNRCGGSVEGTGLAGRVVSLGLMRLGSGID